MTTVIPLKPTLWRTCRVLANHTRLRIIGLLAQQSPQTVSAVAGHLQLALPVASQSLRALESRGLLTVRRTGRHTRYRLNNSPTGDAQELVSALRTAFRRHPSPVDALFKMATAFTHPRRIEIFCALKTQAGTLDQIQAFTHIPGPATFRHLVKLEARGFVVCHGWTYSATDPPEGFGRALARLAAE